MPEIFVNYRTGDEENAAVLVARELSRRFGSERVFLASKSIKLGRDYTQELLMAVRKSEVLVAVVGRRWLVAKNGDGSNPLLDENDWVRKEILEARDNAVRVVPILIGRTLPRLSRSDLPEVLEWLADCQDERFDSRTAESDLRRIGDKLLDLVPGLVDLDTRAAEDIGRQQSGNVTVIGTAWGPVNSGTGPQFNQFGSGGSGK